MNTIIPTTEETLAASKVLHINPKCACILPLIKKGRYSVYIIKISLNKTLLGDIVLYRNEK